MAKVNVVSVPYWGSNYLIGYTVYNATVNSVSVPYWGSNYLIPFLQTVRMILTMGFRPLLGF